MLGAEKPLVVIRNYARVDEQPVVVKMAADVKHGLFGMGLLGMKQTSFTFTFHKADYAFGETIMMQVDCDNSASSIDVWSLKFKLYLCSRQRFDRGVACQTEVVQVLKQ